MIFTTSRLSITKEAQDVLGYSNNFSIIFVTAGIFRRKRANNPIYAMNVNARGAFVDAHPDIFESKTKDDDFMDLYP